MRKKKLLSVLLFCSFMAGAALASEIISIDLNGYGDANAYTGSAAAETAAAGENVWRAYYGDWGKPMGSPRSANLPGYNEPNISSTYAAQVWIGDPGTDHNYVSGSALLDDGFIANPSALPTISLLAAPNSPFSDGEAFGGTFDIYVYGDSAGDFNLTTPIFNQTKSVTGTTTGFVEGENYVVFSNILIDDTNEAVLAYSGELNGIQLVSKKQPVAMQNGTVIQAAEYDVAFETNARSGEIHELGPDIGAIDTEYGDFNEMVSYLDTGEYMKYDITADDVNKGLYDVTAWFVTGGGNDANLAIYIDDIYVGNLYFAQGAYSYPVQSENSVSFNIFSGSHEFEWRVEVGNYENIVSFEFTRTGDVVMNDCADVYKYGFNYASDYDGDCRVDAADLAYITNNWVDCYSPDANECP